MSEASKPVVAISSCVLGENVRWNGTNSINHWVDKELKKHVQLISFCPEMKMGLGTPRATLRLVESNGQRLLQESNSSADHTKKANSVLGHYLDIFSNIDGFIVKAKSPSCGLDRTKLYNSNGNVKEHVAGFFTNSFKAAFPEKPIIDDGRIHDESLRLNFLNRIFIHHRFKNLNKSTFSLQQFHKHHKFLFMAYSQNQMRQLGKLAATDSKLINIDELFFQYQRLMIQMLEKNIKKTELVNSLGHLLGYFKKIISKQEKEHLLDLIEKYRTQNFPANSIIEIFNYLCSIHSTDYVKDQWLLNPLPKSLLYSKTK